jgi:DNA sulfur modification protein DndC
MQAMIQNDSEKEWMTPLLALRNELDVRNDETGKRDDRHLRDFRRMNGSVQLHNDRIIHGPYMQPSREAWLEKLLAAQNYIRTNGPETVREIELITLAELREIRRIWVVEKHEVEDTLPGIYSRVLGRPFPDGRIDDTLAFGAEEIEILKNLCEGDQLHFELTRELLDVERQHRTMARRSGLFKALETALRRGSYDSARDAEDIVRRRRDELDRPREETDLLSWHVPIEDADELNNDEAAL